MTQSHANKVKPVPQLLIEKLVAGVLSESAEQALRERLAAAGELDRIEQTRASNQALRERFPAATMMADIEGRARRQAATEKPRARRSLHWAFGGIAVATAAAAMLLLSISDKNHTVPGQDSEVIVTKGQHTQFFLYRQRIGAEPQRLVDGDEVAAGDTIQLSYIAAQAKYGVIFSIDGRHNITLHFPAQKQASSRLKTSAETALDRAYILDDAPDFERFWFLSSTEDMHVDAILEAAQQQAATGDVARKHMRFGNDINEQSLLLRK